MTRPKARKYNWSEEQLEVLRAVYPTGGIKAAMSHPLIARVTYGQLIAQIRRMGLKVTEKRMRKSRIENLSSRKKRKRLVVKDPFLSMRAPGDMR